ncbi:MAG TPA: glycosyltransferase, partial [Blastocatellia bacterium]|nr:glycosyltransferase [Blastocatellia bacterium]
LPEIYRSSDIFVFPSYTESFGLPLVEAMASGLPIVASDVPVNRELCGDAAIYFSVFDAEDCARAIQLIAEDSGLRCRLREASLKRAKDFTWERHTADLVAVFNAAQQ